MLCAPFGEYIIVTIREKSEEVGPDYKNAFAGLFASDKTRTEAILEFLSKNSQGRVVTLLAMLLLFWMGRELVETGSVASGQVVIGLIFVMWLVVAICEWRARAQTTQKRPSDAAAEPRNDRSGETEVRKPP